MNKNNIVRSWSLVSYLHTAEEIEVRLQSIPILSAYAYILHDMDINENGEIKTPHFHIAIILKQPTTLNRICSYFKGEETDGTPINCLGKPTISNSAIYDYLTHKNEPEKHQYSETAIISSNKQKFQEIETQADNTFDILEDLLNGKQLREMVRLYGRDFLIHYNQYKMLAFDIKEEENI